MGVSPSHVSIAAPARHEERTYKSKMLQILESKAQRCQCEPNYGGKTSVLWIGTESILIVKSRLYR